MNAVSFLKNVKTNKIKRRDKKTPEPAISSGGRLASIPIKLHPRVDLGSRSQTKIHLNKPRMKRHDEYLLSLFTCCASEMLNKQQVHSSWIFCFVRLSTIHNFYNYRSNRTACECENNLTFHSSVPNRIKSNSRLKSPRHPVIHFCIKYIINIWRPCIVYLLMYVNKNILLYNAKIHTFIQRRQP